MSKYESSGRSTSIFEGGQITGKLPNYVTSVNGLLPKISSILKQKCVSKPRKYSNIPNWLIITGDFAEVEVKLAAWRVSASYNGQLR